MIPVLAVALLMLLIAFAQSTPIAPFIHTLF
jgi:hypothetical protein